MSAVLEAIEVIKNHVVPSEEKLEGYKRAIDRHCEEKSQWRQRAEAAEKQVDSVKRALKHVGYGDSAFYSDLGHRVESAILAPRHELAHELKKTRESERALNCAREDMRHHAICLCQLYNKAAGSVLFGLGEKPDLFEIRTAIEAAIEAAVQDRIKQLTTKDET